MKSLHKLLAAATFSAMSLPGIAQADDDGPWRSHPPSLENLLIRGLTGWDDRPVQPGWRHPGRDQGGGYRAHRHWDRDDDDDDRRGRRWHGRDDDDDDDDDD